MTTQTAQTVQTAEMVDMNVKIPEPEPVIEVSAIQLLGCAGDGDGGYVVFDILLKVEKAHANSLMHCLDQISSNNVLEMFHASDDYEVDLDIAGKFLMKFHERGNNSDNSYLVGEIEDVAYPLVCALYRRIGDFDVKVHVSESTCHGITPVSFDDVYAFIRDNHLAPCDWFPIIDAIEFPALDASVEVDKEF